MELDLKGVPSVDSDHLFIFLSVETVTSCQCWLYFKSSWQGIGKSFQVTIIAPQINLTGYNTDMRKTRSPTYKLISASQPYPNHQRLSLPVLGQIEFTFSQGPIFLNGFLLLNFWRILLNIYNKKQRLNFLSYRLLKKQSECQLTQWPQWRKDACSVTTWHCPIIRGGQGGQRQEVPPLRMDVVMPF